MTSSTFGALAYRDFRLLWLGSTAVNLGGTMQQLAVGWLVIQLAVRDGVPTLGPLYIGMVGLASGVPGILFGIFGGVIADRMDRRRLLLFTQLFGCALAGSFATLVITDRVSIGAVLVLAALMSTMNATDQPARNAMLLRIVAERDLMSAVGLNNTSFNTALFLGPLIGGLLIGPIGAGGVMLVYSATFLLGLTLVASLRPQAPSATVHVDVLAALREGVAFVLEARALAAVIGLSALLSLGARPLTFLLPAVVHDTLGAGPVELSWLLGGAGLGSLLGSICSASLGAMRRTGLVIGIAILGVGLADVLFAAQRSLIPALALVVLPGFFHFVFSGFTQSTLQRASPDRLRGRVLSLYYVTIFGVMPLGVLLLGSLGSLIGVNLALGIGGATVAAVGVATLLWIAPVRDLVLVRPAVTSPPAEQ